MADNDERIVNGGFPERTPDFTQLLFKLDNTLGSFTSQINLLTRAMADQQKQLQSITKSNEKFYQEFTKTNKADISKRDKSAMGSFGNFRNLGSLARDVEEFRQELTNSTRQLKRESRDWKYSNRSFKGAGTDIVSARRRQQILDDFAKAYEDHQKYMEQRFQKEEELYKNRLNDLQKQFGVENYQREIDDLRKRRKFYETASRYGATKQERDEASEKVRQIKEQSRSKYQKKSDYDQQAVTERVRHENMAAQLQEEASKAFTDLTRSRDSLLLGVDRLFKEVEDAFEDAQSGMDKLRGRSVSLNKFMEDLEVSKEEKFNDAVEEALEQIQDTIKLYEQKLEDEGEITEEEKENIQKKLEILKEEERYLKRLTPVTDIWKNVGNDLKDTFKNGFFDAFDPIFKNLEDKYLQSYIEGFQKVYDSIENTRNTISARLKLNSGDYKEMQDMLYQEIQNRGLAGSVSMTDVDDMLVSLQAAGITDQAMLQELAIEGAKLKAQGSSLDLGNEETLQQMMQMYGSSVQSGVNPQDALNSLTNMIDQLAATEVGVRREFGYDASLVNGGFNTIFNQIAKMGISSGKNITQITSDIGAGMYSSQALYSSGIDESLIRQTLQSIRDGSISEQDTFAKMLLASSDFQALKTGQMDMTQATELVMQNMQKILSNADPQYIAEIGKAYGLPGNVNDWLNIQQRHGAFTVTPSSDFKDSLDEINEAENMALEQGSYLSETARRQKEQENKATKQAIEAEQIYKGDQLVVGELQVISNMVNSIYGLLKGGVKSSLESFAKGGLEGLGRAGVNNMLGEGGLAGAGSFGEGAGQFLTGASGTKLGMAGKVAGVAVGAGWMLDSITDNIGDSVGESMLNVGTDPEFYRGLGTALGSAAGGPLGAAVGGVIGQVASMGGNKLYDMITDMSDVTDEQMEAAKRLSDAGAALNDSAEKQQKEIQNAQDNILNQKEIFNNYDESMQKQFITQMDIDSSGLTNQEAFARAIEKWEQIELRKIEEMQLKQTAAENTALLSAAMDKKIGGSLFEASYKTQGEQIAEMVEAGELSPGFMSYVNNHKLGYLSDEQKEKIDTAWRARQEQKVDFTSIATEQGYREVELLKEQALRNYAELNNLFGADGSLDLASVEKEVNSKGIKLDYEKAAKQLYGETISTEDAASMASSANILTDNRNTWVSDNSEFQKKWGQIVSKNPGASVMDLVEAYNKEFLDGKGISIADVIDGFFVDSAGLYAEYTKGDGGYPQLRYKSKSGTRLYDPTIYHGKFEAGLSDVPYNGYPAILDEGERVLTRKEADVYNELSSYAVSQLIGQTSNNYNKSTFSAQLAGADGIRSSIRDQTRSTEDILNRILVVLQQILAQGGSTTGGYNPVNRGARNMNSNITSMNTRI